MRFRAPASSANLGPGFDALALALALYVQVEVDDSATLLLETEGEGAELAVDPENHLAVRVARHVSGKDNLHIRVRSEIPVGRGLGSSAALAAATAAAAGAADPFAIAAAFDGHPENAAASVFGGLVAAATLEDGPVARQLVLDPLLSFVVIVPDRSLPTAEARAALPKEVALADAAANLGRMGLLVAGLADRRNLIAGATGDRLHQGPRTALFPQSVPLLGALMDAGALASSWSGAGPSLIGICDEEGASAVRARAEEALCDLGLPGRVLEVKADLEGLHET